MFIENDTHTDSGVKDDLIEMWVLGESNEVVTSAKASNFTRAAVGRTNIPVYDGNQCVQHNSSTIWVKTTETCLSESKCGKSIKHPWRADLPVWFFLRFLMFLLVPFGVLLFIFKWCKDRRRRK